MGASREEETNAEFAQRMRAQRGEAVPVARTVVADSGVMPSDGEFIAYVTVSDRHPWYGEAPPECTDGGQTGLDSLLAYEGESIEAYEDSKGWNVSAVVQTKDRAHELLRVLCAAANAAVSVRQSGTVTSSR